jgi:hypothetical protein
MSTLNRVATSGIWLIAALVGACQASHRPEVGGVVEVKPGGPDEERLSAVSLGRAPRPLGQRAAQVPIDDDVALNHDVLEPDRAPRAPRPLTIGPRMSARCRHVRPMLERVAQSNGLDPYLLLALAWVESGFDPEAGSSAGARGLMQLMPMTATSFGCDDLLEPRCSARAAANLVQLLLRRFDGDMVYALCAYETGAAPAVRARKQGALPANIAYAERVLEARARLERSGCEGR